MNSGEPWQRSDDFQIISLRNTNTSWVTIATKIGRTEAAVKSRYYSVVDSVSSSDDSDSDSDSSSDYSTSSSESELAKQHQATSNLQKKKWSKDEEQQLLSMNSKGKSIKDIAIKLGRSESAIRQKRTKLLDKIIKQLQNAKKTKKKIKKKKKKDKKKKKKKDKKKKKKKKKIQKNVMIKKKSISTQSTVDQNNNNDNKNQNQNQNQNVINIIVPNANRKRKFSQLSDNEDNDNAKSKAIEPPIKIRKLNKKVKHKSEWEVVDVAEFVSNLGIKYKIYYNHIVSNAIDGDLMEEVTIEELKEFIPSNLHCRKILKEWRKL